MPTIQTADGTSLSYRDWGTGEPVLFCAAWALSGLEWQYQMLDLNAQGLRAIAYDRRGHGRSDDPGHGYDYDTLADDLAAVIDHLDLHNLTLVAHSMGGGEIIRYITRHGAARVARVALVGTTLPCPLRTADNPEGIDAPLLEAVRAQWASDFGHWIEENEGPYFGEGLAGCATSPLTRSWTCNDMLTSSLHAVLELGRTGAETDFRAELNAIDCPVLIVHGDNDASSPLETSARRCTDLLPHAKLTIYQNAPHGLYLTHRERLSNDLTRFALGLDDPVPAGLSSDRSPQAAEAD
jgi:non-heme chloroperoxidase